jgi:hypothetical protein
MVILLIRVIFLLLGIIVGIIYQLASEMLNITDLIRENAKVL